MPYDNSELFDCIQKVYDHREENCSKSRRIDFNSVLNHNPFTNKKSNSNINSEKHNNSSFETVVVIGKLQEAADTIQSGISFNVKTLTLRCDFLNRTTNSEIQEFLEMISDLGQKFEVGIARKINENLDLTQSEIRVIEPTQN
jgi:hypothetical protein